MSEVSLRRLRMVMSTMTDGTVWRTDGKFAAVELVSGPVSKLGSLINNLIEGRENVIRKLHLSDGGCTRGSCTDSETGDTLLREGSVEYAIGSILGVEVHGAPENATKFDIFAEAHGGVILGEGNV